MKREVKIGIFTVAIICCSWAGIRFLSGMDIFGRNTEYYASYSSITGIGNASAILIQGVKVGAVTDIILDPTKSDKVTLKFSIKRRYQIPSNSTAQIFSPSLMSSMAIGITLGDSPTFLEAGDTITSSCELGLMDVAAEKLLEITDQVAIVSQELTQTLSSINSILDGGDQDISNTLANLSSISEELSDLLTSQSANMESAVEGISQFSQSLGGNAENIDNIIVNLGQISDELAEANLSSSLSTTLTELNTTLSKINSAEGSAGMLLSDEALYENLANVSGSLNELLLDMQANPKRYVHFSLFGSKE